MILSAAIKDSDGVIWSLPEPNRHHNIFKLMYQMNISSYRSIEGFVDDERNFLDRNQAWIVAEKCNQIVNDIGVYGKLLTEHLW